VKTTQLVVKVKGDNVDWQAEEPVTLRQTMQSAEVAIPNLGVSGDVLITVLDRGMFSEKTLFGFWFHTSFVTSCNLVIPKAKLDKACSDTKHRNYCKSFAVELEMTPNKEWVCPHVHDPNSGLTGDRKPRIVYPAQDTSQDTSAAAAAASPSSPPTFRADSPGVAFAPSPIDPGSPPLVHGGTPSQHGEQGGFSGDVDLLGAAMGGSSAPLNPVLHRVLFDYETADPAHLVVKAAQLVTVLKKDPSGWWLATFDGNIGWIPEKWAVPLEGEMDQC